MTIVDPSVIAEREALVLEGLRAQYEDRGFDFVINPSSDLMPGFLGSYRPDAIARKSNQNIAIEIKDRRIPSGDQIASIRKRFAAHPDWRLDVVYMAGDPSDNLAIPASDLSAVRARLEEIVELDRAGHRRAAFILAWSVLESSLLAVGNEAEGAPRTPGAVIQSLAMNGYLSPQTERQLRALTSLRNRLVHGDLRADATAEDTSFMLSAIDEVINPERVS